MFKLNGKIIRIDADLVVGEGELAITIPAASLQDAATRAQYGIEEVLDQQPRPDDRFYIVTPNGDGTYSAEPKDLDALKYEAVRQVKQNANALISPTDWKIVREAEGACICDQKTKDYRADVRVASDQNELAIMSAKTVEDLAAFVPQWPKPLQA